MSAAVFTQRTVQVPASPYFGLSASTAVPLFSAGAVPYVVYEPSSAALATFGWTGQPYRVLVFWQTLSSVMSDGGTNNSLATNIGLGWTEGNNNLGSKLGYGTANDGHLASPISTWPTLVVGIQGPAAWVPATAGAIQDGWIMIHDAVMKDVFANYTCDQTFIYGLGTSGGATTLEYYLMGQSWWPTRYPIRYAAAITISGAPSGSGSRQTWPEAIQGENSTNQTFPRMGRRIARDMTTPWWDVHSTGDTTCTPTLYNPMLTPVNQFWPNAGNPIPAGGQSAGTIKYHGKYFRFQEYQGVNAPNHNSPTSIWDYFLGNNNTVSAGPGGRTLDPTDPWATWMFQQRLVRPPTRMAISQLLARAAGGSTTPPTPSSALLYACLDDDDDSFIRVAQ